MLKGLTNQTRPDTYKRKPLTIEHLRQLKADLFGSLIPRHDQLMLWSAFTMAFYGMLRVSEYTSSKETSFDKSNLVLNDLQISCDSVQICLRRDKTHRKTEPPAIYLTKTQTDTCPVQALHAYMLVRYSARHTPLFISHDGSYLTRQRVNRELQFFLGNGFTSHSFRIGAASTASKAGCSMEQIRAMGRWSSDVSNRYVRPDMVSLTQAMLRISPSPEKGTARTASSVPTSPQKTEERFEVTVVKNKHVTNTDTELPTLSDHHDSTLPLLNSAHNTLQSSTSTTSSATTDSLATEYAKSIVASTFRRLKGHINSPASDEDHPISTINADLLDHHHNQHVQTTRVAQQQIEMAKNANSDDIERHDEEKGGERDAVDKVKTEQQDDDDDNANEIPKKVKLDADTRIETIAATKINIPMPLFHGHDDEEIGIFIKKFETACKLQRIPARDMVEHAFLRFRNSADSWWNRRPTHNNETWEHLKADLKTEFRPAGSLAFRTAQLNRRNTQPGESVNQYYDAVMNRYGIV
ncbi:hypothetical protein RvY_08247 [Ramazzottius varieornatus]|uniref:Tyr recombinase domain-containing protein n=1 Tax=Ramazzottius varieornatus TaxID=947166 RepID=A0A1D1VDC5_RAMVA|nr:hypothetical protein RvY_08247 [Ramazzottius varieornatus]